MADYVIISGTACWQSSKLISSPPRFQTTLIVPIR